VKRANAVLSSYGTTIFEVMSRLAVEHDAINLGQGFPDGNGPDDVRRAAADALEDRPNQYPSMMGVPELRQAVAAHAERFYRLDVDWQTQVMVTSGATEALAASLLGLLDPGDEAVVFEPVYDTYIPIIRTAGATAVPVCLEPPGWQIDRGALAAAFSDRTKLVVVNSPMNPSGKVFSRAELEWIAELTIAHDAYAVCDEVYEHIVFDGLEHVPLMTLPGMAQRAVRIGSAGKTFSLTGWKVGYVTAGPRVLAPIAKAHQFLTFTTPPNLQRAIAYGLGKSDDYFRGLASDLQVKRDRLAAGLAGIGFGVAGCDGTYFVAADFAPLGFAGDDVAFCRHITTEAKVAAVPFSAFYPSGLESSFVRFCFCKRDDTLDEAVSRLAAHFRGSSARSQ
jgi:aspartate/methionine/tyrosine aminotransferase